MAMDWKGVGIENESTWLKYSKRVRCIWDGPWISVLKLSENPVSVLYVLFVCSRNVNFDVAFAAWLSAAVFIIDVSSGSVEFSMSNTVLAECQLKQTWDIF